VAGNDQPLSNGWFFIFPPAVASVTAPAAAGKIKKSLQITQVFGVSYDNSLTMH
jgi:hypothetical protein